MDGGVIAAASCSGSSGPDQVTVTFDPELPDLNCCEIEISTVSQTYCVGNLEGDANQNKAVDPLDFAFISQRLGKAACGIPAELIAQTDLNCGRSPTKTTRPRPNLSHNKNNRAR